MRWLAVFVGAVTVLGCGGKTDVGDGGTDAAIGADAGSDGPMCTYQETRTSSERTCSVSSDCVVVVRSLSCCQEQNEGIRSDAAQTFDQQQASLTAGCPGCGCAAQPVDELGNKGTSFVATCDNGACTAHAQ
jgi:hypothetical protein